VAERKERNKLQTHPPTPSRIVVRLSNGRGERYNPIGRTAAALPRQDKRGGLPLSSGQAGGV